MFLPERRRLGRPTKEVLDHAQKLEEERERVRKLLENEIVMCGIYKKDTEFRALIVYYQDMDNFWIKNLAPIISYEERRLMETATSIKLRTGSLMYKTRPFATEPSQIKLFRSRNGNMLRCQIRDLFTYNIDGILNPYASIALIDTGAFIKEVSFNDLFDIPHRISFYSELEWEAKPARLHLGEAVPLDFQDVQISQYTRDKILNNAIKEFTIKILDYKKETYHIDIIDKQKSSLIKHLRNKFNQKLAQFDNLPPAYGHSEHIFFEVPNRSREALERQREQKNRRPRTYNSITSYYKEKFRTINEREWKASHYQRKFIQVKIINWTGPEGINIIPNDQAYIDDHTSFMKELDEYQDRRDNQGSKIAKSYKVGQRCLFYNYSDVNLGKWVRGVIVESPGKNDLERELAKIKLKDDETSKRRNPRGEQMVVTDNLVYRLRSVDYGYEVLRHLIDIREVPKDSPFVSRGPWSLRCRLFGIHPLDHDVDSTGTRVYSSSCKDMIDSWLRERILDQGKSVFFNALFKGDINRISEKWGLTGDIMDIVIFSRFDYEYRPEDCFGGKRRKPRYDSLNSYLIDKGVAGDCNLKTGQRSYVDLDEYFVNILVQRAIMFER